MESKAHMLAPGGCSRLEGILNEAVYIRSSLSGSAVALRLVPRVFLSTLFRQLQDLQVLARAVHLEGSAATACLLPHHRLRFVSRVLCQSCAGDCCTSTVELVVGIDQPARPSNKGGGWWSLCVGP
jgi:hypothetical protein